MQSNMATQEHGEETIWNSTSTGEVVPSYPIVPMYIFSTNHFIAGMALVLNILNIIVITSMPKTKSLAGKNFKTFVIYLSILNIIMTTVQLLTDHQVTQNYMSENHWSCVLTSLINHSCIICAGWQLFLVSVERFMATISPHKYPTYLYVRKFIVPLVGVHLAVTGVYGGLGIALHDRAFSVKGSGCCQLSGREFPKLSLLHSVEGFVIAILITVIYISLLTKRNQSLRGTSVSKTQAGMKRLLLMAIGALLMSKWVGWLPIIVTVAFRGTPYDKPIIDFVARLFLTSFYLTTPLAYGITNSKYRKFLAKFWTMQWKKIREFSSIEQTTPSHLNDDDETSPPGADLKMRSLYTGYTITPAEVTDNSFAKESSYINQQYISD